MGHYYGVASIEISTNDSEKLSDDRLRELQNVIEEAVTDALDGVLDAFSLTNEIVHPVCSQDEPMLFWQDDEEHEDSLKE